MKSSGQSCVALTRDFREEMDFFLMLSTWKKDEWVLHIWVTRYIQIGRGRDG
jgi:hypothetical protein